MFIDIIKVIKLMYVVEFFFFIVINDYKVEGLIYVFFECLFLFFVLI